MAENFGDCEIARTICGMRPTREEVPIFGAGGGTFSIFLALKSIFFEEEAFLGYSVCLKVVQNNFLVFSNKK